MDCSYELHKGRWHLNDFYGMPEASNSIMGCQKPPSLSGRTGRAPEVTGGHYQSYAGIDLRLRLNALKEQFFMLRVYGVLVMFD